MINHKLSSKGFTLIEILVVTAIFATLLVVIVGFFVSTLRTKRNVLDSRRVLGEVSYALEHMSRVLRLAARDSVGNCIPIGFSYQSSIESEIKFINVLQDNQCQKFFLEDNQIKRMSPAGVLALTSPSILVNNLRFEVVGESKEDAFQPFVTIYLEAHTPYSPVLKIQTSISKRNLDIR